MSGSLSGPSPVPFEDLPVLPLCLEGLVSLDRLQKAREEGRERFKSRKTEASRFITVSGGGRGDPGNPGPPAPWQVTPATQAWR